MTTTISSSSRLLSLDVFRGLTIAGMIIVNDPGDWNHVYGPLKHASWHGITPTDFVFPFFLFIVGVSIALAYSKRLAAQQAPNSMVPKILKRTAIIFGLGLFLALFPNFNFGNLRIPGVLQRIALVFLACSFLFLYTDWRKQAQIGIGLLAAYWLLMAVIPVPIDAVIQTALESGQVPAKSGMISVEGIKQVSDGFIAANFEPGTNMEAWVDRHLVPLRLYQKSWDPEGLLSTLPSIVTGILGMLAGHILLSDMDKRQKTLWLMMGGFLAMSVGNVWDWFFPFNKNLWSNSFVMYTGGLACMTLGALYWFIDVLGYQRGTFVGKVFGANAITAYVLHGMLFRLLVIPFGSGKGAMSIKSAYLSVFHAMGLSPEMVSLIWALSYTAICFLPIWMLYRKKIFIKI